MIRSSLLGRWALGLFVLLAGSASVPAVDLYVTASTSNSPAFGKINSTTGVYTDLNSNLGGGVNYARGLAWNPSISQFNTLRDNGTFNTISTTGTVGLSPIVGLINYGVLAYNPNSSTMYSVNDTSLNTVNPATGAQSNIGNPGVTTLYSRP